MIKKRRVIIDLYTNDNVALMDLIKHFIEIGAWGKNNDIATSYEAIEARELKR